MKNRVMWKLNPNKLALFLYPSKLGGIGCNIDKINVLTAYRIILSNEWTFSFVNGFCSSIVANILYYGHCFYFQDLFDQARNPSFRQTLALGHALGIGMPYQIPINPSYAKPGARFLAMQVSWRFAMQNQVHTHLHSVVILTVFRCIAPKNDFRWCTSFVTTHFLW